MNSRGLSIGLRPAAIHFARRLWQRRSKSFRLAGDTEFPVDFWGAIQGDGPSSSGGFQRAFVRADLFSANFCGRFLRCRGNAFQLLASSLWTLRLLRLFSRTLLRLQVSRYLQV